MSVDNLEDLSIMTQCIYCGSNRIQKKGRGKTNSSCKECEQIRSTQTLKNFLIFILENNKYRWGKVVNHNKGKRSEIAIEVRKLRDSKYVKKNNWADDYTKPSTNKNTKIAKWKRAKAKKWRTFKFKGTIFQTSDYIQNGRNLKKKK
jgi:hypothetical protein